MRETRGVVRLRPADLAIAFLFALVFMCPSRGQQPQAAAKEQSAKNGANHEAAGKGFHEDLNTLTLESSTMVVERPKVGDNYDAPGNGFIRERFQLNWRMNDPFDLYIVRPRGVEKAPVMLYLYSFPDDTEVFKNNMWCEWAVRGGYAAVGFVSALTGHRLRFRPLNQSFISEMQEGLAATTHDVQLILDFLATREYLDMNRVGMFGVGSGGAVAILASAADARIKVVDVLGPWGDWPEWFAESKAIPDNERANFTKQEFLATVARLDPVDWLPKMKAKHVRIEDVRGNKSMPDKCQEKLEAAASDFAEINEYGNGRAFLTLQPQSMLFDWMKDQLKPDSKPDVAGGKSERFHFYPAIGAPGQLPTPATDDVKRDMKKSKGTN